MRIRLFFLTFLLDSLVASAPLTGTDGDMAQDQAGPDCVSTSLNALQWTAENFYFHSSVILSIPEHEKVIDGWVSFNLTNSALPFSMSCYANSSGQEQAFFDGSQWLSCSTPDQNTSEAKHTSGTFRFDRVMGRFDIAQRWFCPGEDGATFDASGTTNVTLDCATNRGKDAAWSPGQLYSMDAVACGLQNVTIIPDTVRAWA
ncbi:hypothetical protein B0H63DRAFT_516561 [Podospora didyma]|uniref:AA1-like domain-containing protein n=1 Tax=Podospora didyma TaxID=330526 RepID=A0AAE0U751_9PEZI|nr:hypothetical protein B0H63DRAFT_516561 [Podospora didyma]